MVLFVFICFVHGGEARQRLLTFDIAVDESKYDLGSCGKVHD